MLFPQALVLHSQTPDGRHILTTLDAPPLLIGPVAANHCRGAVFLLRVVTHKLAAMADVPSTLMLSRADIPAELAPATGYPELEGEDGAATIALCERPAPAGPEDVEIDPEEPLEFLTVLPPDDWSGDHDSWLVVCARRLGLDVAPALGPDSYHSALAKATAEVQRRLPEVRARFHAGLEASALALKVGLPTRSGGTEFVWFSVLEWDENGGIRARLESKPHDCEGYKAGQIVTIASSDVVDYVIGGPDGLVDPGLTQRIAEDYGLIIP